MLSKYNVVHKYDIGVHCAIHEMTNLTFWETKHTCILGTQYNGQDIILINVVSLFVKVSNIIMKISQPLI